MIPSFSQSSPFFGLACPYFVTLDLASLNPRDFVVEKVSELLAKLDEPAYPLPADLQSAGSVASSLGSEFVELGGDATNSSSAASRASSSGPFEQTDALMLTFQGQDFGCMSQVAFLGFRKTNEFKDIFKHLNEALSLTKYFIHIVTTGL